MNPGLTGFGRAALTEAIRRYTALGGILVGTGDSARASQLPVGTDGQVVTADSTQTLGVKWATPSVSAAYATVQDEGVALTQRSTLNAVGRGIVADDSGGVTRLRVFDVATMSYEYDEFYDRSTSSGLVGKLGWNLTGLTIAAQATEASHPGIYRGTGSSSANTSDSLTFPTNTTGILPADLFDSTFVMRFSDMDNITTIRVGLTDTVNSNPATNGIYIEGLSTDFAAGAMTWFGVTRSGGSQTRTSTAVSSAANAWVKFRIRRIDASTIGFQVNDQAEVTSVANIPTAGMLFSMNILSTSASNARHFDIDFWDCLFTGLSR